MSPTNAPLIRTNTIL